MLKLPLKEIGGLGKSSSQISQIKSLIDPKQQLAAVSKAVGEGGEFSNEQTLGQNSQNFDESRILQRFIAEIPSDNVSDPSSFPVTPRSIRRD